MSKTKIGLGLAALGDLNISILGTVLLINPKGFCWECF
jgi:hypothetical protein